MEKYPRMKIKKQKMGGGERKLILEWLWHNCTQKIYLLNIWTKSHFSLAYDKNVSVPVTIHSNSICWMPTLCLALGIEWWTKFFHCCLCRLATDSPAQLFGNWLGHGPGVGSMCPVFQLRVGSQVREFSLGVLEPKLCSWEKLCPGEKGPFVCWDWRATSFPFIWAHVQSSTRSLGGDR